jgi:xylulose-5-phosphate/fructose-6-phosphate phosphoketolase
VLHLNGYKIANPTILARIPHEELESLLIGYGHKPYFVEGDDPSAMHQKMASTLEQCILEVRSLQQHARSTGDPTRPRWPMIVLRSPKGWTGPKEVDGHKVEGTWRAHQVPVADPVTNKKDLKIVEAWMRSYSRKNCSTPTERSYQSCRNLHLPDRVAFLRIRTQMVDCCVKNLNYPTFVTMQPK